MAFTRSLLNPKQSYTARELADAADVLAVWVDEEPRCRVLPAEVLRLRDDGPMLRFDGNGGDAGQWVQVCFIRKSSPKFPAGTLKLAAACGTVSQRSDFTLMVARAIRDVLQNGAAMVYLTYNKTEDMPTNRFIRAMAAIVNSLELIDPNLFSVAVRENAIEKRWEVTLA